MSHLSVLCLHLPCCPLGLLLLWCGRQCHTMLPCVAGDGWVVLVVNSGNESKYSFCADGSSCFSARRALCPNGRGGWIPFRPLRGLQETRVATREESGVLVLPSRRGLTPRGSLECNPEIPAFPGEEQARNPSLLSGVLGTGLPGLGTEHLPGPDPSSKATLWVKAQHEGALPPPCIVRKDPRVPHTARRGA